MAWPEPEIEIGTWRDALVVWCEPIEITKINRHIKLLLQFVVDLVARGLRILQDFSWILPREVKQNLCFQSLYY